MGSNLLSYVKKRDCAVFKFVSCVQHIRKDIVSICIENNYQSEKLEDTKDTTK